MKYLEVVLKIPLINEDKIKEKSFLKSVDISQEATYGDYLPVIRVKPNSFERTGFNDDDGTQVGTCHFDIENSVIVSKRLVDE